MTQSASQSNGNIYFFGCDMGGWHTDKGDALAVCKWDGSELQHVEATAGALFHPVTDNGPLMKWMNTVQEEDARFVFAIDGALAWPTKFAELVASAPSAEHRCTLKPSDAISNPYLYRQTERFIKNHLLTTNTERPLSAPGDKFGNNSSKSQVLAAWMKTKFPNVYRPPFDQWDTTKARESAATLIEVYPAASLKSPQFRNLLWPLLKQSMGDVGNTDIADAKRCAFTGICYAATVGLLRPPPDWPTVFLPSEATSGEIAVELIQKEGWIFAPRCD